MIRSLRRKFILIAMASLFGTMVVLCTAIGIGNHCITTSRADHVIALLRQNGGKFLPPNHRSDPSNFDFQITPETPFETRYFIVVLTAGREIESVNLDHIAALDRRTDHRHRGKAGICRPLPLRRIPKSGRGKYHYRIRLFSPTPIIQ